MGNNVFDDKSTKAIADTVRTVMGSQIDLSSQIRKRRHGAGAAGESNVDHPFRVTTTTNSGGTPVFRILAGRVTMSLQQITFPQDESITIPVSTTTYYLKLTKPASILDVTIVTADAAIAQGTEYVRLFNYDNTSGAIIQYLFSDFFSSRFF